jgi:hypothetical protein
MPCLSDAAIRAASHQGDIGSGVLEGDELAARGAAGSDHRTGAANPRPPSRPRRV